MKKVIITGANGVGKSHFAGQLASVRPTIPLISIDAIKLESGWRQRTGAEVEAALARELDKESWILEGGPSYLLQAIEKADALVWLDPPEYVRAWQLLMRPWRNFGRTRSELPEGNEDWPLQQYRFAIRSLMKRSHFHSKIFDLFASADGLLKWRCKNAKGRAAALTELARLMG